MPRNIYFFSAPTRAVYWLLHKLLVHPHLGEEEALLKETITLVPHLSAGLCTTKTRQATRNHQVGGKKKMTLRNPISIHLREISAI